MFDRNIAIGRGIETGLALAAGALLLLSSLQADAASRSRGGVEQYVKDPMPPGFQVVVSELEGPVFADAKGKTLYQWPLRSMRNGNVGESKGQPICGWEKITTTAGVITRYPAGLVLPDLDRRRSCAEQWPPVLASGNARPVGGWSIVERSDGKRQWALDGSPLYTSILDQRKGDVLGASKRRISGEGGAPRQPVGPRPEVPPGFTIIATSTGRMIATDTRTSVYVSDADRPGQSDCRDQCLQSWTPVVAPAFARQRGDWSVVEREPGVRQWAFRKQPLYTYRHDIVGHQASLLGSDVSGWHNVYTQLAPALPKEFTIQDASAGQVLADAKGRTIYLYRCIEDTVDQFECDGADDPQAYRLAICGAGDATRCQRTFPYAVAGHRAKSPNRTWTIVNVDPRTGRRAAARQAGAVRVWAYRGRPVFTFSGDTQPGEINGNSWGNFQGERNGFKAFWLRDDYYRNDSSL